MGPEAADTGDVLAELRATLGKLELALAAIPEAIAWVGASGAVQWCNGRLDELAGLRRLEILGRQLPEIMPLLEGGRPIGLESHPITAARAAAGKEHRAEFQHPSGKILEVTAKLVELHPGQSGFVVVFRDVTERRAHEAASRRLAAIVESTDDAIWAAGFDGVIVDWNRAAEKLYGYTAREAIGKHISMIVPPGQPNDLEHRFELLRRGERVAPHEARRVGKDGKALDAWVTLSAIRDESGRALGVSAIVRDLGPRKHAEAELRRAHEQLGHAYKELEAFSYSVSHDLKAPLRAVASYTELFLRRFGEGLDPAGLEMLRQAVSGSNRMRAIIDDLGRLSHATFTEIKLDDLDLSGMIREILGGLRREDPGREVEAVVAEGVKVTGDPGLLRLAFENLLGNAWKFTAKTPRARIEFGSSEQRGERVLWVKDNGPGFDPARAPDLFTPFTRMHGKEFPGTGIGLTIVRRVALKHGGRVWAEASPGRGATFYMALSWRGADSPGGRPAAEAEASCSECEASALIVDDESDAQLARIAFSEAAPEIPVAHAPGGSQALEALRRRPRLPAVVMLDLKMPGLSGLETLAEIRRDPRLRGLFVIIFSSSSEPRDVEQARRLGADLFIPKPGELKGYYEVARRVAAIVRERVGKP